MLAKRRAFYREGKEIIRTPLLLPSFSSKGFPEVKEIMAVTSETITDPYLISAYDLSYSHIEGPYEFAPAIFIDSGGYEASKDVELSDLGTAHHNPSSWSKEQFIKAISSWDSTMNTVMISYDHPQDRLPVVEQISRADEMLPPKSRNIFREILFKPDVKMRGVEPEVEESLKVNIDAIIANIHKMDKFDAIGVTEKEIGDDLKERMVNIAKLRKALNKHGFENMPMHIFGSLDTVSTPLYFVAGADIFDGLTWLRFSYYNGMTIYKQNYSAFNLGIDMKSRLLDARCCFDNYRYIKALEGQMKGYLKDGISSFSYHRDLIRTALRAVEEETGG